MPRRFPMPPRRQPALSARLSGHQGGPSEPVEPMTPDDFETCAARLDACSAALRAAAATWRTSADPASHSARVRAGFAIYADVLDAAEALNSIAQKGGKG